MTVKSLYDEYRQGHPGGYQRSAFGRYLQHYTLSIQAVGHVEHYAGDQMYIDYTGDKQEIVDAETGEVRSVEVFVAILPCSHYTYCEASWSQRKEAPQISQEALWKEKFSLTHKKTHHSSLVTPNFFVPLQANDRQHDR